MAAGLWFSNHALQRFEERIGFAPTKAEQSLIDGDICAKRALLLRNMPDGTQSWLVMVRGIAVRLMINPEHRVVLTAMEGRSNRLIAAATLNLRASDPPPYRHGSKLKRNTLRNQF
jgi:hypothetical protein